VVVTSVMVELVPDVVVEVVGGWVVSGGGVVVLVAVETHPVAIRAMTHPRRLMPST
jgi:hypothetical protein